MTVTPPARDPQLRAKLEALPKIELHRHLEGSLRLTTLIEVAQQYNLDVPKDNIEALRPLVQVTTEPPSFRTFLDKFAVLRKFYQSPELIRRYTYEVVEDAARDNVRYMELRFTPAAHARVHGYPLENVADWVLEAVGQACRDYPRIRVGLIASINRHESLSIAEHVTQIAIDRMARGIVGLDLAGDEVNFHARPFRKVFLRARDAGMGLVAHAGEWMGASNVRDAIEHLGVHRIGHGVRIIEDPDVVQLAHANNVAFEVCVTSNLQTAVAPDLARHPLHEMNHEHLPLTINTDDPSISAISLTDEYEIVARQMGLGLEFIKRSILTAASCTFLPPDKQETLVTQFRREMDLGHPADLDALNWEAIDSPLN
jgi:adenosine deaminase